MNSRLSCGALLVVEPAPGRIDLEEGVLDEMADRASLNADDTAADGSPACRRRSQRGTDDESMRIALVSPYSWTYPGGVTRHIEALAEQFIARRATTSACWRPYDPRRSPRRGAAPRRAPAAARAARLPVSLGRTVGFKANGAVSNLSITPYGVATLHHELRTGGYDVVHIHEPVAPLLGWVAADWTRLPLVGTFHSYSDNRLPNGLANVVGRPAGAQPPARADRRLRGGGLDRPALVRRPLPGHPQRRPRRSRRAGARGRAARPTSDVPADRVRRPGGRAQGPAAAAARLRGAARAHPHAS